LKIESECLFRHARNTEKYIQKKQEISREDPYPEKTHIQRRPISREDPYPEHPEIEKEKE
jgi:hypothetical protein